MTINYSNLEKINIALGEQRISKHDSNCQFDLKNCEQDPNLIFIQIKYSKEIISMNLIIKLVYYLQKNKLTGLKRTNLEFNLIKELEECGQQIGRNL